MLSLDEWNSQYTTLKNEASKQQTMLEQLAGQNQQLLAAQQDAATDIAPLQEEVRYLWNARFLAFLTTYPFL